MAWITYGYNRRYDPDTGQVQFNRHPGTDQWETIGQTAQAAPGTGLQFPNALQPTWQWAMPTEDQIRQIDIMRQIQQQQAGAQTSGGTLGGGLIGAGASGGGYSYLGGSGAPAISYGAQTAGTAGAAGGAPASGGGGSTMATNAASQIPFGVSLPQWQTWYGQNVGKTITINGRQRTIGQDVGPNDVLTAYRNQTMGWAPATPEGPTTPQGQIGATTQPETVGLQQLAQIDPTSEALRTSLGQSYLNQLQNIPQAPQFNAPSSAAAPNQADVQSYLDLYKGIDPSGYAARAGLAGQWSSYLQDAQAKAALGAQLDPGTIREVEQGARSAQAARGNVYGTPQLVQETMQRGTAGEQRAIQRQQALGTALGGMQGYLGSGTSLGDVANTLYGQGYGRYVQGYQQNLAGWQAQQAARQQAQSNALGYLGSGQTPYQAGATYYDRAQQQAANAASGTYQYNPSSIGANYLSPQQSQYGLDIGSQAQNYYSSLAAYGYGQGTPQKNRAMGAAAGALGGAASGALAGSAAGGIGAPFGAVIGGIGGAASGYFA